MNTTEHVSLTVNVTIQNIIEFDTQDQNMWVSLGVGLFIFGLMMAVICWKFKRDENRVKRGMD